MKNVPGFAPRAFLVCLLALLAASRSPVAAQQRTPAPPEFLNWLPIADAERQMQNPVVEADAGAEVLLWRVHVVDEYVGVDLQRVLYHYVRVKVFNDKGKQQVGTVDLPYSEPGGISEVAGRTVKTDGSILELDRKTVYKRDLVRASGLKEKVVSFAMPGVDEHSIVEYRWKQTQDDNRFRYLRLQFTRDLPVQTVTYFMRPLPSEYVTAAEQMYILPFNCKPSPLEHTRDGWSQTTVTNIPAARAEPYSPSKANLQPWALLYYRGDTRDPQKYWNDEAKKVYNDFKGLLKNDSDLKAAAAQAMAQAKTDEEKMNAGVQYVRTHLRHFASPGVTAAEREEFIKKLPNNRQRTSAEIFKSGIALGQEFNVAFAALVAQAGLEVRPAMVGSRDEAAIDPKRIADRYFVDASEVAIKAGDSWRVFNVSNKGLFPGMLPSDEEGTFAIIGDPKGAIIQSTPVSAPDSSVEVRNAQLILSSDGTLTGDVEEGYSGHRAETYRSRLIGDSAVQREIYFRDRLTRMFPDAEIKNLKIENVEDALKPLRVVYHLEAPRFAQVTGKRILFEPNAFRRAQGSPFSASERRYPVEFPYAWQEKDTIQMRLPQGYELENGDSPGGFDFGDAGSYKLSMRIQTGSTPELSVAREFTFGAKALLAFQAGGYATVKKVFDQVQLRDTHSLSIRGK